MTQGNLFPVTSSDIEMRFGDRQTDFFPLSTHSSFTFCLTLLSYPHSPLCTDMKIAGNIFLRTYILTTLKDHSWRKEGVKRSWQIWRNACSGPYCCDWLWDETGWEDRGDFLWVSSSSLTKSRRRKILWAETGNGSPFSQRRRLNACLLQCLSSCAVMEKLSVDRETRENVLSPMTMM